MLLKCYLAIDYYDRFQLLSLIFENTYFHVVVCAIVHGFWNVSDGARGIYMCPLFFVSFNSLNKKTLHRFYTQEDTFSLAIFFFWYFHPMQLLMAHPKSNRFACLGHLQTYVHNFRMD